MARTKFPVVVLTPEGKVFDEQVEMLSTRTEVGSIGVLARHQPLLATLQPTELRLYRSEDEIVHYAQGEGYLQVADGEALVLVEEAHSPDQLEVDQLQQKLAKAEQDLELAVEGSEAERLATVDRNRWRIFLEIAQRHR